jgi:hypothetical protein
MKIKLYVIYMVDIENPEDCNLWVNVDCTTNPDKIIEIEQAQCKELGIDYDSDIFEYESFDLPLEELKNYMLDNNVK